MGREQEQRLKGEWPVWKVRLTDHGRRKGSRELWGKIGQADHDFKLQLTSSLPWDTMTIF